MSLFDRIHKEYVYIIRTREAIRANENVYKIGMTVDTIKKRLRGYSFYESILTLAVNNAPYVEKKLLELLPSKYTVNNQYGKEYFNVDNINDFIKDFFEIATTNILSKGGDGIKPDANLNMNIKTDEVIDTEEKVPLNLILPNIGNNHKQINVTINNILPSNTETIVNNTNIINQDLLNIDNTTCKRCGNKFKSISKLERHLNRKNKCIPIISNISIDEFKKELSEMSSTFIRDNKKYYKCKYCKKIYNTASGKCSHQKKCKEFYLKK